VRRKDGALVAMMRENGLQRRGEGTWRAPIELLFCSQCTNQRLEREAKGADSAGTERSSHQHAQRRDLFVEAFHPGGLAQRFLILNRESRQVERSVFVTPL
jgi:hypothetical protein